jgi:hypothetical protein
MDDSRNEKRKKEKRLLQKRLLVASHKTQNPSPNYANNV